MKMQISLLPISLQRLWQHYPDAIEDISDERSMGDGYWVYLSDQYFYEDGECRTIHEDTIADLYRAMKSVRLAKEGE